MAWRTALRGLSSSSGCAISSMTPRVIERYVDDARRRGRRRPRTTRSLLRARTWRSRSTCGGIARPAQTCTRPAWTVSRELDAPVGDLGDAPVLDHRDLLDADLARELGVPREVVDRAVDRNEALRTYQLDHAPLLGPMRVTADVDAAIGEARAHLARRAG